MYTRPRSGIPVAPVFLSMTMLSFGALAGDITYRETFAPGTTLTDVNINNTLEDIKTAVDNNNLQVTTKQEAIVNSCSGVTQAVKSIGSTGVMTCIDIGTGTSTYTDANAINALKPHTDDTSIHHSRYSNTEAISALTPHTGDTIIHHNRYSNTNALTALQPHTSNTAIHQSRYTDAEAVTALASHTTDTAIHHSKYTDVDAVAAVNVAQINVKYSGNTGSIPNVASSATNAIDMDSITVTSAANGYVLVICTGSVGINQAITAENVGHYSLSLISQQVDINSESIIVLDTRFGGGQMRSWTPLSITRFVQVTKDTPVTLYATAFRDATTFNSVLYENIKLTAIFLPQMLTVQ